MLGCRKLLINRADLTQPPFAIHLFGVVFPLRVVLAGSLAAPLFCFIHYIRPDN
jgi:hypothetical protein